MPPEATNSRAGSKRATNVSLDEALVAEAKALDINISHAAEAGLALAIRQTQAERWMAENRHALDSSNAYVESNGLPLQRFRLF